MLNARNSSICIASKEKIFRLSDLTSNLYLCACSLHANNGIYSLLIWEQHSTNWRTNENKRIKFAFPPPPIRRFFLSCYFQGNLIARPIISVYAPRIHVRLWVVYLRCYPLFVIYAPRLRFRPSVPPFGSVLLFRPSVPSFCSRCSVSGICVAGVSFRFISSSSISPAFYAGCSFRWHFCRRLNSSIAPTASRFFFASSIVPDIIRRFFLLRPRQPSGFPPSPLLSSPFRHPFTSRRCTGELVLFRIMLGSLACSFFARIFPFSYHFHPKKFAYINYFLYLCTRNEVRIDPR